MERERVHIQYRQPKYTFWKKRGEEKEVEGVRDGVRRRKREC